jgi:hypothetical protein
LNTLYKPLIQALKGPKMNNAAFARLKYVQAVDNADNAVAKALIAVFTLEAEAKKNPSLMQDALHETVNIAGIVVEAFNSADAAYAEYLKVAGPNPQPRCKSHILNSLERA